MYKCREASTKEIIAFQKEFCENLSAAIGMNNKHRVQVEAYEELPPWSFVYNADGSDRFLKDDIIMLKVCDLEKRVVYYPVFPEKRGLKLLQCWDMAVPPKLTAFEQEGKQEGNVHRANQSLRNLIAFARLFMLSQSRWHKPMAYSFNNIISQLYLVPEADVAPETIKLINDVIGKYIRDDSLEHYVKCDNLQDFIDYIKTKYSLVMFKSDDFSLLRRILHDYYPAEKYIFKQQLSAEHGMRTVLRFCIAWISMRQHKPNFALSYILVTYFLALL